MKLKKTPAGKRFKMTRDGKKVMIYEMVFENGDKVIYEHGKVTTFYANGGSFTQYDESITEEVIKQMHDYDDAEVDSNLNEIRCETRGMRKEREEKKRKWSEDNPDIDPEKNPYNPMNKLINMDFNPNDDFNADHSKIELETEMHRKIIELSERQCEDLKEIIRAFVSTLPETQQVLYKLLYIDGLKQSEICKMLNLSKSTVSERCSTLELTLIKKFKI